MKTALACGLLVLALTAAAQDKKPAPGKLLVSSAVSLTPGATTRVVLRGTDLEPATGITLGDGPAKAKLLTKPKKGNPPNNTGPVERLGDWEVEAEIEVLAGTEPGELRVTLTTPHGPTNPLTIAVADPALRVEEKEPNNGYATAQVVTWPCVVEGRIEKEKDVDVYRIDGKPGERVCLRIESRALSSAAELLVTATDVQGHVLDMTRERTPNTFIVTLPLSGSCCVALIEASDLGGPFFGYRLHVLKP